MMSKNLMLAVVMTASAHICVAQSKKGKAEVKPAEDNSSSLVVNGDFESINLKPLKSYAQLVELGQPWLKPNATSADLFATGVKSTKAGAPVNDFGVQEPRSGQAYAGFWAHTKDPKKKRTYLQGRMKSKLEKDKLYCVRFHVSLADLSKAGVNNVGLFFSDRKIENDNDNALTFKPQILEKTNRALTLMDGWEPVCGTYIAKGTEEYFLIGGFGPEEQMKPAKVKKPAGISGTVINGSYYYIDDIEIFAVEANSQCACGAASEREDDVIYSRAGAKSPDMTADQAINSTSVYFPFLSASINSMFEEELIELSAIMKANPLIKIELTGHSETDEMNEAKINPRVGNLADRRAQAVKAFLTEKGIDDTRIEVVSKDDSSPVNTSGTKIGRAQNRRVDCRKL
jgi:outer membrane protein OmpA-like peptidoglycan-associated protein